MIYDLLEVAMFYDMSMYDFWNMTLREVRLYIKVRKQREKYDMQQKAVFDYTHANMIIKGIGCIMGSKERIPSLEESYSFIFNGISNSQYDTSSKMTAEERVEFNKKIFELINKEDMKDISFKLKNNKEGGESK